MLSDLKAKLAAKLKERKDLYIGIGAFAAGAQAGPLAAKGVEYAAPYLIDGLVKLLGG